MVAVVAATSLLVVLASCGWVFAQVGPARAQAGAPEPQNRPGDTRADAGAAGVVISREGRGTRLVFFGDQQRLVADHAALRDLARGGFGRLVIDVEEVTAADERFAASLLLIAQLAKLHGDDVLVVGHNPMLRRLLGTAVLDAAIDERDDRGRSSG
jgi:hypothetical protein